MQSKECQDHLQELHLEYYDELLQYQDEFEKFKKNYTTFFE